MEQIGLQSVFGTEAFSRGLSTYLGGLGQAEGRTTSVATTLGNVLSKGIMIGVSAFAALGAAAIAAGVATAAGISKIVFDSATMADKLATLSGQTGISTTRLQELDYVGKLLDVDLEAMTSGLRFLTKSMYAAQEGTGEQADAFKTLGIQVKDSKGNLRDADTVFYEVIDALHKMKNPTEQDAIVMKLMGRSAMELNPLIKAGSSQIALFSEEAHKMGAVVGADAIEALDKFKDQTDALKLAGKSLIAGFAAPFLPIFQKVVNLLREVASDPKFQMWINGVTNALTGFVNTLLAGGGFSTALSYLTNFGELVKSQFPAIDIGGILTSAFGSVETASQRVLDWVNGIDWKAVSSGAAASMSAWLASVDWQALGADLGKAVNNLGTALLTILKNTDWEALAATVGDVGMSFGEFLAASIIAASPTWGQIMVNGLSEIFTGKRKTDWTSFDEAVNLWWLTHIQNPISNFFTGIPTWWRGLIDGIVSVFQGTSMDWTPVDESINLWFLTHIQNPVLNALDALLRAIRGILGSFDWSGAGGGGGGGGGGGSGQTGGGGGHTGRGKEVAATSSALPKVTTAAMPNGFLSDHFVPSINVNINANMNSNLDVERVAYRVATVIARRST